MATGASFLFAQVPLFAQFPIFAQVPLFAQAPSFFCTGCFFCTGSFFAQVPLFAQVPFFISQVFAASSVGSFSEDTYECVHFNSYSITHLWFVHHDISFYNQSSENFLNPRIGQYIPNTLYVSHLFDMMSFIDMYVSGLNCLCAYY